MSLKALFGNIVPNLQGQTWSKETQRLVDILSAEFSNEEPIQLDAPLSFVNNTSQPAINIRAVSDSRGIEVKTPSGQSASMGVGLGNTGLVANEFIPQSEYFLDPDVINTQMSTTSGKGGAATIVPGEVPDWPGNPTWGVATDGGGVLPSNVPANVGATGRNLGTGRGTGYKTRTGIPSNRDQEIASGGGAGSDGSHVNPPTVTYAGGRPGISGRSTGTGIRGSAPEGLQVVQGWGEALGFAIHGTSGLELSLNNTRYTAPKTENITIPPSSSTNNAIVRWGGADGTWLKDSSVYIDDSGKVQGKASFSNINAATDGATITFDLDLDNTHTVTLGGNRTLAISNVDVGQKFAIRLKQDGTGSRTVTWWSQISWPAGTVPTLTTTAAKSDWFGFICTGSSGGNPTYDAFVLGQNY